jgi:hypothetical protein
MIMGLRNLINFNDNLSYSPQYKEIYIFFSDKQYGEWMHIWNELTQCAGKKLGYQEMVGASIKGSGSAFVVSAKTLYIPLEFWFCRNPGLALPLIALQYHEVKVNIEFNDVNYCSDFGVTGAPSMSDATLYVDYIYLDTDERRRFAQVSHEYLIEQLQFTGDETATAGSNKFKLNFNHPTKELVWVTRTHDAETSKQYFNFTTNGVNNANSAGFAGVNPVNLAKLQLNGHDRFSERKGKYFNYVQPYQHHENVPVEGINVYSFALKPEEHQPSGSCNFSRIDNATLQVDSASAGVTKIFAVNYNVFRIMSGMGGLNYIIAKILITPLYIYKAILNILISKYQFFCKSYLFNNLLLLQKNGCLLAIE